MAGLPSRSNEPPSRRTPEPAGWCYEIDGESFGPVTFRELRTLAAERQLLAHHQIWKSGSDDRQEAGSILGLIPTPKRQPNPVPPSDLSDDDPYATPKVRTIWDGPPGGMYLPHLHSANLLLFLGTLIAPIGIFFLCQNITSENTRSFLYALAGLSLAAWVTLTIIYLYRAWEMMHMFGAKLNGGRATRLLFIPVFNALWSFISVAGWARLWNYNVKHHPGLQPARRVWQPSFVLFPILFLVSQGLVVMHFVSGEWPVDFQNQNHLISLGLWALTLLVALACWLQIGVSINFLARKKS